ncbi:MAG: exopolysaccharide biosynthesis protein [Methylotenera sp.]|uniref:exopolysaccharide biosynthesis protein n=1 Tax=Methylotenera sp. TaxID=2051956 RepID=UPI002488B79D|nr:exopolysaccharide biosynthesis protein [Methylotenera sp.]MDI1308897.1 exopolysaccharide biosynthesis protein [Methylotenera sp.]
MTQTVSGYDDLVATLNLFSAPAAIEPLAFGTAIDQVGADAYTLTATITVLPFLQPFPLGVFALIGSAAFLGLGLQLFRGEQTLSLPNKLRNLTLNLRTRQVLVKTCLKIMHFFHRFTKPRLRFLVEGKLGQKMGGFIFIAVGVIVAIPLAGMPFKNLFPSLAILFYCTGETEHDGLMVIFSLICIVLSIILYCIVLYIAWRFGAAAIDHFFWK